MSRVTGIRYQSHSAAEADTLFPPTPRYSAAAARLAGGGGGIRYIAGAGTPGRDRVAPEPVEAGGPRKPNAARAAAVSSTSSGLVRSAVNSALSMFGGNKNVQESPQESPQDAGESVDEPRESVGADLGQADERPKQDNNEYMALLEKLSKGDNGAIQELEQLINNNAIKNNKCASEELAIYLLQSGQEYNSSQVEVGKQFDEFKKYVLNNLGNTTFKLEGIDQESTEMSGGGGVEQTISPDKISAAIENLIENMSVVLNSQDNSVKTLLAKISTSLDLATTTIKNEHMYALAIQNLIKAFQEKASNIQTLTESETRLQKEKTNLIGERDRAIQEAAAAQKHATALKQEAEEAAKEAAAEKERRDKAAATAKEEADKQLKEAEEAVELAQQELNKGTGVSPDLKDRERPRFEVSKKTEEFLKNLNLQKKLNLRT